MGLQEDWAQLTVRELLQQFHEPTCRRLRLFLLADCRADMEVFQGHERSPGVYTAILGLVETAEKFADGCSADVDRRRTITELEAVIRPLREYQQHCEEYERRPDATQRGLPDYRHVLRAADQLRLALASRLRIETTLAHVRYPPSPGAGFWFSSRGQSIEPYRRFADQSVSGAVLSDWFDRRLIDMAGNARASVAVDPVWLNWNHATVPAIARHIYDDRAFHDLPILADALEDAGCTNADLLDHCRGPEPHVRGCWAIDLLLGKA